MARRKYKVWSASRFRIKHSTGPVQTGFFSHGEDLPLFSGTPQIVRVQAARPKPLGTQLDFFEEAAPPPLEPPTTEEQTADLPLFGN